MTNPLERRIWQHKNKTIPGFTKQYNCDRLVYFEMYDEVTQAIAREKQVKKWSRSKKDWLTETVNPDWHDLAADWYRDRVIPSEVEESRTESPEAPDPSTSLGMTQNPSDGS